MTGGAAVRVLVGAFGIVAMVSALRVLIGGPDANTDGEVVGASLDSEQRFFNAIWLGFGGFALWQALRGEVPRTALVVIVTVLFAGGVGRVVSLIAEGRPHTAYLVLMAIELCAPALLLVRERR